MQRGMQGQCSDVTIEIYYTSDPKAEQNQNIINSEFTSTTQYMMMMFRAPLLLSYDNNVLAS